MITKDTEVWGTPHVTLLEYGTGDIITNNITPAPDCEVKYTGISCRNSEAHPVEEIHDADKGKTVTDLQPDVVFLFTKVESIDVVLEMLGHARRDLVAMLGEPTKSL